MSCKIIISIKRVTAVQKSYRSNITVIFGLWFGLKTVPVSQSDQTITRISEVFFVCVVCNNENPQNKMDWLKGNSLQSTIKKARISLTDTKPNVHGLKHGKNKGCCTHKQLLLQRAVKMVYTDKMKLESSKILCYLGLIWGKVVLGTHWDFTAEFSLVCNILLLIIHDECCTFLLDRGSQIINLLIISLLPACLQGGTTTKLHHRAFSSPTPACVCVCVALALSFQLSISFSACGVSLIFWPWGESLQLLFIHPVRLSDTQPAAQKAPNLFFSFLFMIQDYSVKSNSQEYQLHTLWLLWVNPFKIRIVS